MVSSPAGCDASLVEWLGAGVVGVSTGSIVSTTGAALARASLATFPDSVGCDASFVEWLGATAVVDWPAPPIEAPSRGSAVSTTGAAVAVASFVKPPIVLTVSDTVASTGCTVASTGVIAPATSLVRLPTVSVTVVSTGCTAASTGAIVPATSWVSVPTVASGGPEPIDGLNEAPNTLD